MAGSKCRASVGDYVTLVRGTTYKGALVGKPGPALLGLGSIEPGGGFRIGDYKTYGGDCPADLMLFPGDLYASLKGATKDGKMIGSVARVPPSVPTGRLTQDTVKLVFKNPNADDASFLHWILRTPQYREYCAGRAMGSAVVALSRHDFLDYRVPQPTPERKAAVALLDEIEARIELNRRMNETLEAMARALFKSWFVDFDPVRAKVESDGHPSAVADLYPNTFAASELGLIPAGWRVTTIRDLTSAIQYGLTQSASVERVGPHFLRITDIQGGKVNWGEVPFCEVSSEQREKYGIRAGDIFVARTGASTGENIYLSSAPEAVFASYLVRFQFSDPAVGRLVGAFMRTDAYFDYVAGCLGGSAQPNASAQLLAGAKLVVPPTELARKFYDVVAPLDARIERNNRSSQVLVLLRDALLPKLISGELRVKAAKKIVEAVA